MRELKSREELKKKIREQEILIVQFGSEHCMPCQSIKQKLDAWTGQQEQADAVYIPIEKFPDLAAEERVFTVPVLMVYTEGKCSIRESGCFSLLDVLQKTERYMSFMR